MKRALVEFLRDPVTMEPLSLSAEDPAGGAEITSGTLRSASGNS